MSPSLYSIRKETPGILSSDQWLIIPGKMFAATVGDGCTPVRSFRQESAYRLLFSMMSQVLIIQLCDSRRRRNRGQGEARRSGDGTPLSAAPGTRDSRTHRVPVDARGMKIGIYRLKPAYPDNSLTPTGHSGTLHPSWLCSGHIFLEAEENDTSFIGRSSDSGSSRPAPSRPFGQWLVAVRSPSQQRSCRRFALRSRFNPTCAGTCELPDYSIIHKGIISQACEFVKLIFCALLMVDSPAQRTGRLAASFRIYTARKRGMPPRSRIFRFFPSTNCYKL